MRRVHLLSRFTREESISHNFNCRPARHTLTAQKLSGFDSRIILAINPLLFTAGREVLGITGNKPRFKIFLDDKNILFFLSSHYISLQIHTETLHMLQTCTRRCYLIPLELAFRGGPMLWLVTCTIWTNSNKENDHILPIDKWKTTFPRPSWSSHSSTCELGGLMEFGKLINNF